MPDAYCFLFPISENFIYEPLWAGVYLWSKADAPTAIIDNLLNDHVSELAAQLPTAWQSVMIPTS